MLGIGINGTFDMRLVFDLNELLAKCEKRGFGQLGRVRRKTVAQGARVWQMKNCGAF